MVDSALQCRYSGCWIELSVLHASVDCLAPQYDVHLVTSFYLLIIFSQIKFFHTSHVRPMTRDKPCHPIIQSCVLFDQICFTDWWIMYICC